MVSDMDAMFSCSFNLCDVRMRIAITCIVPRGYLRGLSSLKKVGFWGEFYHQGEGGKGRANEEKVKYCLGTMDLTVRYRQPVCF